MRRTIAVLAALGLMLVLAAPQALAADGPNDRTRRTTTRTSSCSRSTTSTAISQPNTPGSIQVGCCNPVVNRRACRPGGRRRRCPRAASSTSRRTSRRSARANSNTITVGAGDLIGASPLVSALFHDEPTIEALNALGLDVTGVGNHEFDEGVAELLRMQYGGCHPVDGCQDGDAVRRRASSSTSPRTSFYEGTDKTILPPYEIRKIDNAKIAFIGLTLEGTPTIVTPAGVAGLEFRPEVADGQRARRRSSRSEQGVRAFVVLLHQGGFQTHPRRCSRGPRPAGCVHGRRTSA